MVVAVLGDEAGLFGRGTSGEGCDVADLRLPGGAAGRPAADLGRLGYPVVLVLVTGRPYAIGSAAGELAGVVQAFFPGEEGGGAIAGVLSGLSYTSFAYSDLVIEQPEIGTDGTAVISCTVRNTGARAGAEVVQLYLSDPVAQVVRPARWLAGCRPGPASTRPGAPGHLPAARRPDRVHRPEPFNRVPGGEAGRDPVAVGGASDQLPLQGSFTLGGPERAVGPWLGARHPGPRPRKRVCLSAIAENIYRRAPYRKAATTTNMTSMTSMITSKSLLLSNENPKWVSM